MQMVVVVDVDKNTAVVVVVRGSELALCGGRNVE
jgi:hypothetical protein